MPVREAARRAGISDGTWRRIESGADVERKASTVAAMAAVLGITPGQLVAAGRRDAAGALEQRAADTAADPDVSAITGAPQEGDVTYQALMAEILAGLAAIDAEPGLTSRTRHQLRAEFLTGLRRSAGEFQRQLRILRRAAANGPELSPTPGVPRISPLPEG
jgi:transcriptional regulator with XRE-family HTH domain